MEDKISKIVSLAKRRGFIFQSSEIYGGFSSCYDFGPLGVEMKNNIKNIWWKEMVQFHNDIVGLDAAILMSPKVWEASGHLTAGFADELVECKKCHTRHKKEELPHVVPSYIAKTLPGAGLAKGEKEKIRKMEEDVFCPNCKGKEFTKPRKFNLMMKTFVGPVEKKAMTAYLRAETCQGIYVNFDNVLNSLRLKIPFGIAQIGKSFRNEITPKDFIYRTREFEQMEMQWFCHPKEAEKFFDFWVKERFNWYLKLGIKKENLRLKEHKKEDLAHYAKKAVDIEYKFSFGWKEIEGIHNRGDWDLSNHAKHSGKDLRYFNEETKERYFPYIIETSGGVDRSFFVFLVDSYQEIKGARTKTTKAAKEIETILTLHKKISPIKIAILPLVRNKSKLVKKSKEIFDLLKTHFKCQYDELGSIGRRYRRQDEIGTPFCITCDFETLESEDVTIRDRDSMQQERIKIKDLINFLNKKLLNNTL